MKPLMTLVACAAPCLALLAGTAATGTTLVQPVARDAFLRFVAGQVLTGKAGAGDLPGLGASRFSRFGSRS